MAEMKVLLMAEKTAHCLVVLKVATKGLQLAGWMVVVTDARKVASSA